MPKQAALRDITHEELNDREELVNCLVESWGSLRMRSTPDRLPQVCVGLRVIQLYGFDTTKVIVITSELGVAR